MPQLSIKDLLRSTTPPTGWWARPRQWLRTERFWQEVVTRTIAGIIAGAVILALPALYFVLSGFVTDSTFGQFLAAALFVLLIFAMMIALALGLFALILVDKPRKSVKYLAGFCVLMTLALIASVYTLIRFATGY